MYLFQRHASKRCMKVIFNTIQSYWLSTIMHIRCKPEHSRSFFHVRRRCENAKTIPMCYIFFWTIHLNANSSPKNNLHQFLSRIIRDWRIRYANIKKNIYPFCHHRFDKHADKNVTSAVCINKSQSFIVQQIPEMIEMQIHNLFFLKNKRWKRRQFSLLLSSWNPANEFNKVVFNHSRRLHAKECDEFICLGHKNNNDAKANSKRIPKINKLNRRHKKKLTTNV